VRMSLDGALITDQGGSVDIPCRSNGSDGTSISPVDPGSHRLDLVGMRSGVPSYWLPAAQVSVSDGVDTTVNVNLPVGQPASATADVSWDALASGGGFALGAEGAMTCSEAQVDVVRIALDPNTDGTGGMLLGDFACAAGDIEGTQLSVPAGTHSFSISGIRGSTIVYQTTHPASARFELGLLSNVDVDAAPVGSGLGVNVMLSWDFSPSSAACPVSYTLTDPSGAKQMGSTSCGTNGVQLAGPRSGLWSVDATAGSFRAQVLFGVPNQSSASWNIPFSK